jgi:hypothetical protein
MRCVMATQLQKAILVPKRMEKSDRETELEFRIKELEKRLAEKELEVSIEKLRTQCRFRLCHRSPRRLPYALVQTQTAYKYTYTRRKILSATHPFFWWMHFLIGGECTSLLEVDALPY